jgi:hypothetical protein
MPSPSTSSPARRVRQGMANTSPRRSAPAGRPRHAPVSSHGVGHVVLGRQPVQPRGVGAAADDEQRLPRTRRRISAGPVRARPGPCAGPGGRRRPRPGGRTGRAPGGPARRRCPAGTPAASTPGRQRLEPCTGPSAGAIRRRVYSAEVGRRRRPRGRCRRSACRETGSRAQPTSWPYVEATERCRPSGPASRPSGAAAPNQTRSQPRPGRPPGTRAGAPGVGSSSEPGAGPPRTAARRRRPPPRPADA